MDKVQVIKAITNGLDWFALIVMFLIGGFTAFKPYKAWHIFKSKKQEGLEPNEKNIKSTRRMGFVVMFLIAIIIIEKII